jgi:hypothetical protein
LAGTNNFLVFDQNNTNIETDTNYNNDTARLNGVGTGIASSLTHNKLYRQVSIMTAALAQFLANCNNNASDADVNALITSITKTLASKNDLNTWALNKSVADTGTANNYIIATGYSYPELFVGMIIKFTAVNANTGPSAINVDNLGYVSLVKGASIALVSGDISANQVITAIYDGTNFEIIPASPTSLPANGGNSSTVNNHTASATPNTSEKIDLVGMINEVDNNLTSHEDNTTTAHGATASATPNTIVLRDANGALTATKFNPDGSMQSKNNTLDDGNGNATIVSMLNVGGFEIGGIGINTSILSNNADLNTVITSGFYRLNATPVNSPDSNGTQYGQLIVSKGADTILQILTGFQNNEFYVRQGSSIGTSSPIWEPWRKLWHDGNMGSGSGLDADTVDGLHSSAFAPSGFGLGGVAEPTAQGTDMDTLKTTGFYQVNAGINAPPRVAGDNTSIWHYVMVMSHDINLFISQIAVEFDTSTVFTRVCNTGVWTPWRQLSFNDSVLQLSSTPNTSGYWDTSTTNPTGTTRLNYSGYLYASKVYNPALYDYAEYYQKQEDADVEIGDVISLVDSDNGECYAKSTKSYDPLVVGVYSGEYAQCIGGNGDINDEDNFIPIGEAGRVHVKITGIIEKGDLVTSSDISGVAMKSENYVPGTIIGKALESKTTLDIGLVRIKIMKL